MITKIQLDESGVYPISATTGFTNDPTFIQFEDIDPITIYSKMLVDDVWVQRPTLEDPEITLVEDILNVVFKNLPTNTSAKVYDKITGVLLGETSEVDNEIAFQFTEQGGYSIEVFPPKPYIGVEKTVEF